MDPLGLTIDALLRGGTGRRAELAGVLLRRPGPGRRHHRGQASCGAVADESVGAVARAVYTDAAAAGTVRGRGGGAALRHSAAAGAQPARRWLVRRCGAGWPEPGRARGGHRPAGRDGARADPRVHSSCAVRQPGRPHGPALGRRRLRADPVRGATGGRGWLVLAGSCWAFLTKLLQAWVLVPASVAVALVAGAGSLGRRLARTEGRLKSMAHDRQVWRGSPRRV
ncbi:MAG: 4-amino-4-deoxy-L-arabinose transferase [Modestobacter sp.]|nr:4-amino-4-deoxy-L-arabinose transferase [Modestobacter sp.]